MTDTDSVTSDATLHGGDALDLLDDADALPDESAHAIVTDPPYGIAFMGSSWDDFDPHEYQSWCKKWAEKAMRVVKPGGHLLAFSGERTFHRLMCGVEDAGWNVRTSIMWLHGQGFPKGADVSKHIDRYYDAEDDRGGSEQWDGWETQLKPAFEPIVVARKPLSESAIYKNVLEHGTGAYNIDACRIEATDGPRCANPNWGSSNVYAQDEWAQETATNQNDAEATTTKGRYPANVALDAQAAAMLDEQTGNVGGGVATRGEGGDVYGDGDGFTATGTNSDDGSLSIGYGDSGGASRFYYTSKASTSERTHDGEVENDHPTVKPTDLMQWLVRLVTAEGQTVLDPFTGSGTTGVACLREGREFVGIEREAEYREIARQRLADVASDAGQQTLGERASGD